MNNNTDITLCLTIGKRPNELRRTLLSLFEFEEFEHIIAINDFGDEETNHIFQRLCPHGILINLGHQVGHHKAIDEMYKQVKTPYIFHCEDDWLFTEPLNLTNAKTLLKSPVITGVCFRKLSDFAFTIEEKKKIITTKYLNIEYCQLDNLHKQWHGFTFNPSLIETSLWHRADRNFSQFKKERHISRWQRKLGNHIAFPLLGASCQHIGENLNVSHDNRPPTKFKKIKKKLKNHALSILKKLINHR